MAPVKKKVVPRKRVLDLASTSDNSPPRSSWQAKYQELLPADSPHFQNGASDKISSTTCAAAPMGLVGDYNSDSDSDSSTPMDSKIKDFMKEIEMESEPIASSSQSSNNIANGGHSQVSEPTWLQCFDQNSGFAYYWNQQTNEVSWQPPPALVMAPRPTAFVPARATALPSMPNLKKKVTKKPEAPKKKKKYPWEGNSDSEDEQIELITSFGPQSEDDSGDDNRTSKRRGRSRRANDGPVNGPQISTGVEEAPDVYETSSLMTPLVADVGPPGEETPSFGPQPTQTLAPDSSADDIVKNDSNNTSASDSSNDAEDILNKLKSKARLLVNIGDDVSSPVKELLSSTNDPPESCSNDADDNSMAISESKSDFDLADEILAEIEKEVPPDFADSIDSAQDKAPASFALIASYGDDSDVEDTDDSPQVEPTPKPLFPSAVAAPPETLFPCVVRVTSEQSPPVVPAVNSKEIEHIPFAASPPPIGIIDPNLPDSTTTHKAFKRKKRIDLAGTSFAPSTSRAEPEFPVYDPPTNKTEQEMIQSGSEFAEEASPVLEPNIRYNMDPTAGEHRGFGFSQQEKPHSGEKKPAGIQFIKAETILFQPSTHKSSSSSKSPVLSQDLMDGAALLKEKLAFLGEGKEEVSAVQLMAIQLETLVTAWQSGALTPAYLCQWLGSRAVELLKNEQAAAPPGWTCEWEREAKRYCYRNEETGLMMWDYPDTSDIARTGHAVRDLEQDGVQEEVEMELSDTPPRMSPTQNEPDPEPEPEPLAPPPPVISRSLTPPPPPPPVITYVQQQKTARGTVVIDEQVSSSSEGRIATGPSPPLPESYERSNATLPPLPPPLRSFVPPPPPPEPDEPPPPGVDDDILFRPRPPASGPSSAPDSSSQIQANNAFSNITTLVTSSAAEVSTSLQSGRKRSLISELDSFYNDIAKLDSGDSVSTSKADNSTLPGLRVTTSPKPSTSCSSQSTTMPTSVQRPHSPTSSRTTTSQEPAAKKKKKSKLAPGLALKKKGVSSLVAKWQQVREEARRNYSSDEDNDDVSSTH